MAKWISVEDRLPEKSGRYLTNTEYTMTVLDYSAHHKLFNVYDGFPSKDAKQLCINVTHWMPLPEPPREVDEG